jgi:hypothetical protein
MARRIENECAFCAEEFEFDHGIVGNDWKVYCSATCAESGEALSDQEWRQLMSVALPSRDSWAEPIK